VEIWHYLTTSRKDPCQEWLEAIKNMKSRVVILRRVDRLKMGNFGDHKFCEEGVWELRIDFGPGYRVYYALHDKTVVLLLCGGTKRTQVTDIKQAVRYWRDYQRRQK
jgi:putative addiction module killer protein